MNSSNLLPRPRSALAAACMLALVGGAAAAPAAEDVDAIVQLALADAGEAINQAFDFDEASVGFASDEMGSERVVKGAPYCADAVHESVQTLADGNRIVRSQKTRLCRDGEGRTRQEVERGERKLVWLRDPVARQGWLLDPQRKTARRLGAFGHATWFNDASIAAEHADQWRAFAEQAREQGRVMAEQARQQAREAQAARERLRGAAVAERTAQAQAAQAAQPPQPVLMARGPVGADGDAKRVPGQPMEIQVLRLNEMPPVPPPGQPGAMNLMPPPPPPIVRWQAQHGASRGPGVLSSLGSKDIEGVRANGERTTWTIEAGKIGNEKPIQIVREVWTSPELLLTVQSRDADPRTAERVYRLANLKRGEPEAALMKVPSDYTVSGAAAVPSVPATPAVPAVPGARKPPASGGAPKG
ncbi:hypothetical protein [Ideonella sp.]|uniref:hypothetical protein n=1 Tax=Ideonella sp. TaxID=1929293 RepID=UPI0035B186CD